MNSHPTQPIYMEFQQPANCLFESRVRLCYEILDRARKRGELPNHLNRNVIIIKMTLIKRFKNLCIYLFLVVGLKLGWTKILETVRSILLFVGVTIFRSPAVILYQKGLINWFWLFSIQCALVITWKGSGY